MIDYLTQVQPLEVLGLTDAQIAESISNQTAAPIPCYDAKLVLEEQGLVREDPATGQRSGPLLDHYAAMTDAALRDLLGWFIGHCWTRGVNVSSHEYPRSSHVAAVMATLPADMQSAADAIIELGGGKPHAGTTEADVAASRDAYNLQQATEDALQILGERYFTQYNSKIAPLFDSQNTTEADWIAAIQQMAAEF